MTVDGITVVVEGQTTYSIPNGGEAKAMISSNQGGIMIGVLPSMHLCVGIVDSQPSKNEECMKVSDTSILTRQSKFHVVVSVAPSLSDGSLKTIQVWLNGIHVTTDLKLNLVKMTSVAIDSTKSSEQSVLLTSVRGHIGHQPSVRRMQQKNGQNKVVVVPQQIKLNDNIGSNHGIFGAHDTLNVRPMDEMSK